MHRATAADPPVTKLFVNFTPKELQHYWNNINLTPTNLRRLLYAFLKIGSIYHVGPHKNTSSITSAFATEAFSGLLNFKYKNAGVRS